MDLNQENAVSAPLRIQLIGVGGAGCAILEHARRTDLAQLQLAILHTHARVLQQYSIPRRVLVGLDRTHGLGSAGDVELARVMAEHDLPVLRELTADADLIFVVAGLGAGTGSGITPVLAKAAKSQGALVIALVTTPFSFEGAPRHKQAQAALQYLRGVADAVICVPNEKLAGMLDPQMTAVEAFARANDFLVQGIRGLWQMLTRPGLINVDFAYLRSVLRGRHAESVLAMAEARGLNRVAEMLETLFSNPLLLDGEALAQADHLLVSISAAKNLTVAEITRIMEELKTRIGKAELILGTAIDESAEDCLSLTLVASRNGKAPDESPTIELSRSSTSVLLGAVDGAFLEDVPGPRPAPRFVAPAPETTPQKARELFEKQGTSRIRKGTPKWKQETLALEIVSRGRFEKSEPTIHRGADLDVPTYIRRGVPLN
ncbi:MAG TPA: cell division protein FtsZ [Verrucomicrobiae bacterium]|jgi:cell division protein FtsZ|nr:cell division protein FtsZ [Verrucomicrobiae bacterium]